MEMRRFPVPALALALALAATLACGPRPAPAQVPVAPDTSLGGYLETLADSTDRYFGLSAAPVDTAGLDTILFDSGLRAPRRLQFGLAPRFDFSRVDGATPGIAATLEVPGTEPGRTGWGKLGGTVARAHDSGTTLGNARYENRLWLARQPLDLALWAGRRTICLDRDDPNDALTMVEAYLFGDDWTQYGREDGFRASLAHGHGAWSAAVGWRDLLQSPLETRTGWNLFGRPLGRPENVAATRARVRELEYRAAVHWPRVPLRTEMGYLTASRRLGSELDYRRVRAAAGLDLTLGRFASLVPQVAYGRLTGDLAPQASFYLGGSGTLRSLHRDERGGTGMALGKVELIGARDLLTLLRIPHPAALPLQGTVFAASGALWGRDPFTGEVARGVDWPDRRDWRSEVGVGLRYDSALFPPLRCSYAWPVGPGGGGGRWSVSVSRPLDLLGPDPEDDE